MASKSNVNIGARLDRLPQSKWHIKMWLVTAFALLVCWSNGIGGAVQNILLNEIHWLEPGTALLAMWGTTYTAGQLFGALIGGPIGDKIGRKKSILLYEVIHIIAMIGGALSPNVYVLYVFRLLQGLALGALLVVLFAGFTEYVPGKNRGTWSSRTSFIGNWAHPICNGIALLIGLTGVSMAMNWRIQFMIPSILSIIACVFIVKKFPESPRWLESQGRYEEADAIMTSIEKEIEKSTGKKLPPIEVKEAKPVKKLPYRALFKGKLLKRTIVGSLVLIGMAGLGVATGLLAPQLGMFGLIVMTFLLNTVIYMYVCYASAVYVPEMWPTSAKLSGSGFSNAMGRVSNIFFPFLVTNVAASSLGSDIHGFEFGPFIPPKDPNQKIGLGHEVAGEVVKVGAKVTKFKPGDKVLIEPGVPDDSCEYCRTGRYNICPDVDFMATQPNYKGALTQYMTHSEEWTYHIPEGMTTMEAALAWILAQGDFINLLSGSTTVDQIAENVKSAELELEASDVAMMREMVEAIDKD